MAILTKAQAREKAEEITDYELRVFGTDGCSVDADLNLVRDESAVAAKVREMIIAYNLVMIMKHFQIAD